MAPKMLVQALFSVRAKLSFRLRGIFSHFSARLPKLKILARFESFSGHVNANFICFRIWAEISARAEIRHVISP